MTGEQEPGPRGTPVGIITGAAGGIGTATALEFARKLGARLVLTSLPSDDASGLLSALRALESTFVHITADVRKPEDCDRAAATAVETFGRIDFAHANAGVADQSGVANGDPVRWQRVVETNLLGAAYTARAVLPTMLQQRAGHILFTASTSGRETYVGEPLYIASKWGLVGLGHALRKEVNPFGIRVTLIEPGMVDTPMTRNSPVIAPLVERSVPLQADDVARAVVWAFQQPPHMNVGELSLAPVSGGDIAPEVLRALIGASPPP
jgi:NADP-dependent 3-hydroxy acid dehydrogenase YdfG